MCFYFPYPGVFACGCEFGPGFVLLCDYNCHPSQYQQAPFFVDAYGQVLNSFDEMCPQCFRDGWVYVEGRGFVRRLGPAERTGYRGSSYSTR